MSWLWIRNAIFRPTATTEASGQSLHLVPTPVVLAVHVTSLPIWQPLRLGSCGHLAVLEAALILLPPSGDAATALYGPNKIPQNATSKARQKSVLGLACKGGPWSNQNSVPRSAAPSRSLGGLDSSCCIMYYLVVVLLQCRSAGLR